MDPEKIEAAIDEAWGRLRNVAQKDLKETPRQQVHPVGVAYKKGKIALLSEVKKQALTRKEGSALSPLLYWYDRYLTRFIENILVKIEVASRRAEIKEIESAQREFSRLIDGQNGYHIPEDDGVQETMRLRKMTLDTQQRCWATTQEIHKLQMIYDELSKSYERLRLSYSNAEAVGKLLDFESNHQKVTKGTTGNTDFFGAAVTIENHLHMKAENEQIKERTQRLLGDVSALEGELKKLSLLLKTAAPQEELLELFKKCRSLADRHNGLRHTQGRSASADVKSSGR